MKMFGQDVLMDRIEHNYFFSIALTLLLMMMMMKMMRNCFCGMVDRQKAFSLISSRDHCQRSSPSWISDMLRARFEPVQNLSSGFVEWSCAVVITTTPQHHFCNFTDNINDVIFFIIFRDTSIFTEFIKNPKVFSFVVGSSCDFPTLITKPNFLIISSFNIITCGIYSWHILRKVHHFNSVSEHHFSHHSSSWPHRNIQILFL